MSVGGTSGICRVMWAGICLLTLTGCSDGTDRPLGVSGEVLWGEEPLAVGSVTLKPMAMGSPTGGVIENGVFSIPASRGVIPGKYVVMIEAYLPTGKQLPNPDKPGEMADVTKQMIPAKYNQRTELRAEIGTDSENHFTFKLDKS